MTSDPGRNENVFGVERFAATIVERHVHFVGSRNRSFSDKVVDLVLFEQVLNATRQ